MHMVVLAVVFGVLHTTSYIRKCTQEAGTEHDVLHITRWETMFVVVHHRELIVHHETQHKIHFFSRER